jgi:hypothetical protein
MLCTILDCVNDAHYTDKLDKIPKYCLEHSKINYSRVGNYCNFADCLNVAEFGTNSIRTMCSIHRSRRQSRIYVFKCNVCNDAATYARKHCIIPSRCKLHKSKHYAIVDMRREGDSTKFCIINSCINPIIPPYSKYKNFCKNCLSKHSIAPKLRKCEYLHCHKYGQYTSKNLKLCKEHWEHEGRPYMQNSMEHYEIITSSIKDEPNEYITLHEIYMAEPIFIPDANTVLDIKKSISYETILPDREQKMAYTQALDASRKN